MKDGPYLIAFEKANSDLTIMIDEMEQLKRRHAQVDALVQSLINLFSYDAESSRAESKAYPTVSPVSLHESSDHGPVSPQEPSEPCSNSAELIENSIQARINSALRENARFERPHSFASIA